MCLDTPRLNSLFNICDREGICLFYGRLVSISSGKGEVWLHVKKGKKKNVYKTVVSALLQIDEKSWVVFDPELRKGNHEHEKSPSSPDKLL